MITLRLTADELGMREYLQADTDRRKYRYAREAKLAAARYGALCAQRILDTSYDWITESGRDLAQEDAVMFAKLAFHGWRAYRMMVGE